MREVRFIDGPLDGEDRTMENATVYSFPLAIPPSSETTVITYSTFDYEIVEVKSPHCTFSLFIGVPMNTWRGRDKP